MTLALSRTFDPADLFEMATELEIVDRYATTELLPQRRWEYALTLYALGQYARRQPGDQRPGALYDIGGRNYDLAVMVGGVCGRLVTVIDPLNTRGPRSIAEALCGGSDPLGGVVTCLSMVEHVPDLDQFCYHLSCLVAPGGLLVLTMPYWPKCGADTAWNNAFRQRIFCPRTYASLRHAMANRALHTFGLVDMTYHGAQVHDYTLASLVLEKRP